MGSWIISFKLIQLPNAPSAYQLVPVAVELDQEVALAWLMQRCMWINNFQPVETGVYGLLARHLDCNEPSGSGDANRKAGWKSFTEIVARNLIGNIEHYGLLCFQCYTPYPTAPIILLKVWACMYAVMLGRDKVLLSLLDTVFDLNVDPRSNWDAYARIFGSGLEDMARKYAAPDVQVDKVLSILREFLSHL